MAIEDVGIFIEDLPNLPARRFAVKYLNYLRDCKSPYSSFAPAYPKWHADRVPDTDREWIEDGIKRLVAANG